MHHLASLTACEKALVFEPLFVQFRNNGNPVKGKTNPRSQAGEFGERIFCYFF